MLAQRILAYNMRSRYRRRAPLTCYLSASHLASRVFCRAQLPSCCSRVVFASVTVVRHNAAWWRCVINDGKDVYGPHDSELARAYHTNIRVAMAITLAFTATSRGITVNNMPGMVWQHNY